MYFEVIIPLLSAAFLHSACKIDTLPNRILSWFLDGKHSIPGCPYVFPNDQAKFYRGEDSAAKWREQYGPVCRIWNGMKPEIVVGDPNAIKSIFIDSGAHLKALNMNSGWVTSELMGDCLGLANNDDWSRIRDVMGGPFHQRTAPSYVSLMEAQIEKTFKRLDQASASTGKGDGMILDPAQELLYLPFFILAEILYGYLDEEMEQQLRDIASLRENLWNNAMGGGTARFSIGKYLPGTLGAKLRLRVSTFHRRWKEFNDAAYARAKAQEKGYAPPIVGMYEDLDRGKIGENELLHTLDEILFVNLDVTVGNFSWNPIFLAAHPDVQDDIREEVRRAREDEKDENTPNGWEPYISNNNTLLMASILESARLKPMPAFAVPQALPTAREVGGYVIPPKTEIVVDTRALNVENLAWGNDRDIYRPRRQCLGKHVVDIMLKTLLAHIVEKYRSSPAGRGRRMAMGMANGRGGRKIG
ncbi:hypothetical protein BDV06DRAFT_231237 [Aspergillus oleicola]